MQAFDPIREHRNGKRYKTANATKMTKISHSEGSSAMSSHEINENEEPEILTLTQKRS